MQTTTMPIALKNTLIALFERDLTKLKSEIAAYETEANLWIITKGISNCAGNLCLHLVGNLNAFIGAEIGQTGYIRQRELEFSAKHVPKATMIAQVNETMDMVSAVINEMTAEHFAAEFPMIVFKEKMTTEFFLVHLHGHLNYHLGQINYHRRLLDQS